MQKYNIIFGGGGIRGTCYPGALKALKETGIESDKIAGSSVGAVFAALYAAGYEEEEIKNIFAEFNMNMFRDFNFGVLNGDISLSKGEIFYEWIKEKIERKFYGKNYVKKENAPVKFKDLKKDLYISTVDFITNTPYIFSKENTPEGEIAFAVRASAGLPGLMKPLKYENMLLVDGDLVKTRPAIEVYKNFAKGTERILEFRLECSRDGREIRNPADLTDSVINSVWYLATEYIYEKYNCNDKYDFIIFDTKDTIMFDFNISKEKKEVLSQKGYIETLNYFEKFLPEKKIEINKHYNKIYNYIECAEKRIKSDNYKEALIAVNEILSESDTNEKYADIYIINEIRLLKKLLKENIKKILFINIKSPVKNKITEKTEYIKELLGKKISENETYIVKNKK